MEFVADKHFVIVPYFCFRDWCLFDDIFRARGSWWIRMRGLKSCREIKISCGLIFNTDSYYLFSDYDLIAIESWKVSKLQSHNIIDYFDVE